MSKQYKSTSKEISPQEIHPADGISRISNLKPSLIGVNNARKLRSMHHQSIHDIPTKKIPLKDVRSIKFSLVREDLTIQTAKETSSQNTKKISFDLSRSKNSGKQIELTCALLKNFESISNFELKLNHSEEMSNSDISRVSFLLKQNYRDLKIFKATINNCRWLNNQTINRLLNFTKFVTLQSLDLDLQGNSFKNLATSGIKFLANAIQRQPSLTELKLNFTDSKSMMNNLGLKILSRPLTQIKNLSILNINCANCSLISEDGFLQFAKSFADYTSLTDVTLDFQKSNISEEGFSILCDSLGQNPNINNLYFDFNFCKVITDTGLTHFAKAVSNFVKLTKIHLAMSDAEGISDKGIIELSKALSNAKDLNYINFDFFNDMKVTEKGLKVLAQNVRELSKIQDVTLSLYRQRGAGNKDYSKIVNKLFDFIDNFYVCFEIY